MDDSRTHQNLKLALFEYQQAQDSAHHHDRISWLVASILWGASILLLGTVLRTPLTAQVRPLVTTVGFLGILIMLATWITTLRLNDIKKKKYARCRQIEEALEKMGDGQGAPLFRISQHRDMEKDYPKGRLTFVRTLVTWLIIVAWATVLCTPR
jgi:hypothetical protein